MASSPRSRQQRHVENSSAMSLVRRLSVDYL
jgi:hypothetical protein